MDNDQVGIATEILLSNAGTSEEPQNIESLKKILNRLHESGHPNDRLEIIKAFVNRDYSNNPLSEVMAEILRPLLEIDFHEHDGTDQRKGAVARQMGLSKGWLNKNSPISYHLECLVHHFETQMNLSKAKAIVAVAEFLRKEEGAEFLKNALDNSQGYKESKIKEAVRYIRNKMDKLDT